MSFSNQNFTAKESKKIEELNLEATILEHNKSGAQLIIIKSDDTNKLFSVNFRTVPQDSTGVAHILEHSVLGGSEKYPVKDPFIRLAMTSLNTYLNAWTYPDKTLYPVSSENREDLNNLMDVYLDAVFHPLINENTLKREGWHYEFDENNQLTYKGVVFNEMKGAMSNVNSVIYQKITDQLYPGSTYAHNSGGEPINIPDLTYEQFKDFHKKFYHPTNAKIVLYGDIDFEPELEKIDKVLSNFDRDESVLVPIEYVTGFKSREEYQMPYPVQDSDETDYHSVISWAISDPTNSERLALEILNYILLETDSSELRTRLFSETSGKELEAEGFEAELLQPAFMFLLKGVSEADLPKFREIVLEELEKVANDGNEELFQAAINRIEFRRRECDYSDNKALSILRLVSQRWNYDLNPIDALQFADSIAEIKADPKIISNVVKKYLLNNPHSVSIDFYPEKEYLAKKEEAEREKLKGLQNGMSEEELEIVRKEAAELARNSETEDSPEDIKKLPMLKLRDLPSTPSKIDKEVVESTEVDTILYHTQSTNGVISSTILLEMNHLSPEELQYGGLLLMLLSRIDTEKYSYAELSKRLDMYSGGLNFGVVVGSNLKDGPHMVRATVTYKYLPDCSEQLNDLLDQVLNKSDLTDEKRIHDIIKENAQALEDSLIRTGHKYALGRVAAMLDPLDNISEQLNGISFIQFLKRLESGNLADHIKKLEQVYKKIVSSSGKLYSTMSIPDHRERAIADLNQIRSRLPSELSKPVSLEKFKHPTASNEAFILPVTVNFVASGFAVADSIKYSASQFAVNTIVRNRYLWQEVRQKGGAYGCVISYNISSPVLSMASYRDPNIEDTINVYREMGKYFMSEDLSEGDIVGAIISGYSDLDPYIPVTDRCLLSSIRHLRGYDDQLRQKLHDELLATDTESFRRFGKMVEDGFKTDHPISIIGNEEKIKGAEKLYNLELKKV